METIILGLGSNCGDSKVILTDAIKRLASFLSGIRTSSVYITKPQDYLDQDDFYNMVVSGNYTGSPASLLKTLQQIEADYGRNREAEIPKGPRTLDIDILFFGSQIVKLDNPPLIIPHPAVYRRAFALIPLLELYPNYRNPVTQQPLAAALAALPDQGVRKSL
ncbi:2-amino-4-hydroxy-6-hydroxymethyldihydropteridine diphosphokinase [Treponema sp. OMZ 855]|uniref:2-amino-4-hydroxy-6- hydroxymethyldihydropteridine diphosphokinase n=1 Tax=Treponema sp. OMZ 855 TaxID=1643512 RepID=UPI0020A3557F|nr:2-amino-4-hydroxy-6-hydroxymethyldihydropteridine diphosphokinase [Treponema sp. OMZ 855]UTC51431.1 2-amino-4-hydroxy-6-hydroxymethyldihydropteridine diphosphokinase [Treponema sp. OMZ 855]